MPGWHKEGNEEHKQGKKMIKDEFCDYGGC